MLSVTPTCVVQLAQDFVDGSLWHRFELFDPETHAKANEEKEEKQREEEEADDEEEADEENTE